MGSKIGLKILEKRQISCTTGNWTTIPLASSPQSNQYADWDIPASYMCAARKTDVTTNSFPSTNVMVECVAFLNRGHEFPGLIPQFRVRISYGFARSISVPPDNSRYSSYPNYPRTASFHILSNSLFTAIQIMSNDSVVLQWLRYRPGDRGIKVRFFKARDSFSPTKTTRPALVSIQLPIPWVVWGYFPAVARQGRKNDHALSSSAEVENEWSYTSTLPHAFMAYTGTNLPFQFLISSHSNQNCR
jgi:hypothetical protein